jgi:hypothetical protein
VAVDETQSLKRPKTSLTLGRVGVEDGYRGSWMRQGVPPETLEARITQKLAGIGQRGALATTAQPGPDLHQSGSEKRGAQLARRLKSEAAARFRSILAAGACLSQHTAT